MPVAALVSTPPLFEGDCLSSDEFLRRWEEMPDLKRAELIEGIVYMSSPVSNHHDGCHMVLATWLGNYAAATPGCYPSLEGTWRMGGSNVPQPDVACSKFFPSTGDNRLWKGLISAGAPELVVGSRRLLDPRAISVSRNGSTSGRAFVNT